MCFHVGTVAYNLNPSRSFYARHGQLQTESRMSVCQEYNEELICLVPADFLQSQSVMIELQACIKVLYIEIEVFNEPGKIYSAGFSSAPPS